MALREQKAIAWWSVFVLFAINILNFYDRHVPGALVEPLRQEFHLTDTQNGLLSSAFVWIYALVGLPIGRLADRASRKKLLGAGVFVWASLTAFGGMATSYVMLLISRLGVGVGEATCAPVGTSWLGDLFPPEKRARALAFFMLAVPIGGSFGFIFTGPFAQAYGWRAALMVAAAPAVILLPLLLRLPEPQRGAADMESPFAGKGEVAAPAKGAIRSVLRIPTM
ncbi:MAG: MFS transporter, partial [Acidobacteria bacterium]|nr:MFS transporter [Acidobacteriota bacterium]